MSSNEKDLAVLARWTEKVTKKIKDAEPAFKKYDQGKLRWTKFAWKGAAHVLRIMHYGADKYDWDNWRKATSDEDRERYLAAALRHLIAFAGGETYDKESQLHHVAHAACCLVFFLENVPMKEEKIKIYHQFSGTLKEEI